MKHIKLNKNWNAEPIAPEPIIINTDDGLELSFFLNTSVFEHIDKDDRGILEFSDVYAYRLGESNEKGYKQDQFRFKHKQLPWGEFYELPKSNWKSDFPNDKVILNDTIKKGKLRHFIFFLKDETFECLAMDYKFTFIDKISKELDEKYPKGYLKHYLTMFFSQFNKLSPDNYRMYTDLYIQMESKNEFAEVQKEVKRIKSNKDLESYLKIANYLEIENFGIKQLNEMIKIIEKHKI